MALTSHTDDLISPIQGRVLIVDDEVELTNALVEMISKQGYETRGFTNGNRALELLREQKYDVLLADLMMPEIDGITLLKSALEIDPNMVCILMTGQGTVQTAVEAMKSGAFDYLLKPFKLNTVLTALHRSLDVRRLRQENVQLRELVNIYELGQVVSTTLDIDEIFQKTCEAAMLASQADEASIMALDKNEQELQVIMTCGSERENLIGKSVPLEGSISGWVALNREPLIVSGHNGDQRYQVLHPRDDISTALSIPVVLGKKLVGVLNLNKTHRSDTFGDGQIKGLAILAHIAAAAVENARLYEQTDKQLRRLAALRTIDLAITSSLDLRITLNIVLDQVLTQLEVETAAILLLDTHTQTLEYAAGRGFRTKSIEKTGLLMGSGHAGAAALERKTVSIPNLSEADPDPMIEELRESESIQALFAAPLIAKGEVVGVLVIFRRSPFVPTQDWLDYFDALAGQAAIAIDSARLFDHLQRSNQQLLLAYNSTIEGWSRALDLRDRETEGHTQRVTEMTLRLARSMGVFDEDDLLQIRRGALLHDIGKMGVPDEILHKPGDLNEDEEAIMRKHPEHAYKLLYPIAYLRKALDIPYYHHERWDGTGYPTGLTGEQIPLAARIFAVVDVWDALRSDRPYREGWPDKKVIDYLLAESGKHFDPQAVQAFILLVEK